MSRVLTNSLTHAIAMCESLSLVFHPMTHFSFSKRKLFVFKTCNPLDNPQCSFDFLSNFVCLCICGPWIFEITPPDAVHLFDIFDGLSPPVIMSNLNKFKSFTMGWGDLPHLVTPNTCIFIFILYYHESQLDAVRFELPTHSPRMVN